MGVISVTLPAASRKGEAEGRRKYSMAFGSSGLTVAQAGAPTYSLTAGRKKSWQGDRHACNSSSKPRQFSGAKRIRVTENMPAITIRAIGNNNSGEKGRVISCRFVYSLICSGSLAKKL